VAGGARSALACLEGQDDTAPRKAERADGDGRRRRLLALCSPTQPSNAPSLAAQLQRGKKERPRSGSSVAVAATALSAIARVALGPEPVVVPVQPSSDLPPTSRTASTLTAPVLPLQVLPEPRTPPVNPLVKPSSSLLMADVASEGAQQSAPRAPTAPHRP
jgi:hypothetical protein